jgi:hypothetical protein
LIEFHEFTDRPYAISRPGTSGTISTALTPASSSAAAAAVRPRAAPEVQSSSAPASAAITTSACWACWLPSTGMPMSVKAMAPVSDPIVLTALTRATGRPGSPAPRTAASASGKLAPHSSVAGSIATAARNASNAKVRPADDRTSGRNAVVGCHAGSSSTMARDA